MKAFPLVGGLLCLDLVNTEPVLEGARVDLLPGFAELVRWLHAAGALGEGDARRALARWEGTVAGKAAWSEAIALRAALRTGAERIVAGEDPGPGMARAVNRVLALAPVRSRLVREGGRWVTRTEPPTAAPVGLLLPVAQSAAWLLEHGDPSLVRRCDGPRCVLLFYDSTKNRSRRWCSMEGCGSRAKAAAYYRRKQRGRGAPGQH
jgi:predicted RNA-binding Zn ribbon-like protein